MIDYEKMIEEAEKRRKAEIKEDLYQWGIWSRQDGTGKLRDTSGAMYKNMPRAANEEFPLVITDEYAEQIDEIMLEINLKNKELYEIAKLFFIRNRSTRDIARMSKCKSNQALSQPTVSRRVNDIVNHVEKKLNQMVK